LRLRLNLISFVAFKNYLFFIWNESPKVLRGYWPQAISSERSMAIVRLGDLLCKALLMKERMSFGHLNLLGLEGFDL
jgi:hypothetical protein